MKPVTRRRMLTGTLGSAAALLAGYSATRWIFTQDTNQTEPATTPITRTGHALGTSVSITVACHTATGQPDLSAARVNKAIDDAFAELNRIEDVLSLYRPHSQVAQLNRTGHVYNPHPYLLQVLEASLDMSRRSRGAFDVTVQPLWEVYAKANRQGVTPNAADIDAARSLVDYRQLHVKRDAIRFKGAASQSNHHAGITFNGIAQGFAVDRVKAVLLSHGIEHALFDIGELGSLGRKEGGLPWKAGIEHPRDPQAYVALVNLDGRSLATSGDYATSFDADHRSNHLFDPRTGRSPAQFASVSIVAPSAMLADALSTAVFVMDAKAGQMMIEGMEGVDGLFVFKDGRQFITHGFPRDLM